MKRYAALFQRSEPANKAAHDGLAYGPLLARQSYARLENVARKIVALGDEDLALSDLSSPARPELRFKSLPCQSSATVRVKIQSLKGCTPAKASRKSAERELIAEGFGAYSRFGTERERPEIYRSATKRCSTR